MPEEFSFQEVPVDVRAMHLLMTESAVLESRAAQVMECRRHRSQCGCRYRQRQIGMAFEAYEPHLWPRQHPGVCGSVRLVAGAAAFQVRRRMWEHEGAGLLAVARSEEH